MKPSLTVPVTVNFEGGLLVEDQRREQDLVGGRRHEPGRGRDGPRADKEGRETSGRRFRLTVTDGGLGQGTDRGSVPGRPLGPWDRGDPGGAVGL